MLSCALPLSRKKIFRNFRTMILQKFESSYILPTERNSWRMRSRRYFEIRNECRFYKKRKHDARDI